MRPTSNKIAYRLRDGRTEFRADVGEHRWRCVCAPEDGHDHAAVLDEFSRALDRRDAVLANLQDFIGLSGTVRGAQYTIVDVGVQVLGPGLFRATIAADVLVPNDEDGIPDRRIYTYDFTRPREMRLQAVVAAFMDEIGARGDRASLRDAEIARFLA